MENQEDNNHHHRQPETELVAGGKIKSVHISLPDDNTTAAVMEDSTAEQSAGGGAVAEPELVDGLEKMSSFGSSMVRNASARIMQEPQELTRRPYAQPSAVVLALKGLEFISKTDGGATWDAVEKRFDKLTLKTNRLLPRSSFGECIGNQSMGMHKEHDKEFSVKLFNALARRNNISGDSITKAQLEEFWKRITNESFDCRLEIFFDMIDKDADGKITEDEVREIISSSASSNELSNIKNNADDYARTIMEYLDPENLGYIMVENLEKFLLQGPNLVRGGGDSRSNSVKRTQDRRLKRWQKDFQYFLLNNWQRIWVMALWIGVMAGLFAYKYIQYRYRAAFDVMGHCVCMAKGAAETLKLNMALILLPMCRKTITWLRNKTVLGSAVPFDDNINFHKVIAVAIGIGVGIHGITHLACDFPRLLNASPEKYEPMRDFFGDQPTSYWHFVKGWEGVTGIVMVVLMAIAFILASSWFRRNNNVNLPKALKKLTGFNAFWYSHHLFIIVYAALFIHGIKLYLTHEWYKKTTWMYLAIPITIYAGERLTRLFRSRIKAVKILKVALYPENVLALHMSKPPGFKYKSGQYIFVNCAAVSPFEWHPFSITSAPGDDYVSVHIRIVGDWTGKLRDVWNKSLPTGKTGLHLPGEDSSKTYSIPTVLIDGPYGAPTQDYKDYEVVLLIGLGIGATPMISVVKDIINSIKAMDERENALEEGGRGKNYPSPPSSTPTSLLQNGRDNFKLRRVYFYWVTKKQCSFEWFKNVMNEAVEVDHNRVIEMHSYCASVYKKEDARSAPIAILQSINLATNGVDVVSGTRVKSYFDKPKWSTVYERIANDHPNSRVGVFYCGPPQAVKELKNLASDFSHDKNNTKFEFHKENF